MAFSIYKSPTSVYSEKVFLLGDSANYKVSALVELNGNVIAPYSGSGVAFGILTAITAKKGEVLGQEGISEITTPSNNTTTKTYWGKVVVLSEGMSLLADFDNSIATHSIGATYDIKGNSGGLLLDASSVKNPGDTDYPRKFLLVRKVSNTKGEVKVIM
jgi:hypothetical protein